LDARKFIVEKQRLWAARRAVRLGGPFRNSADAGERERGLKVWVYDLRDNLFEPLTDDARSAFERADGGELDAKRPGEGNMHALHSSSAAACNLFHYWQAQSNLSPIARACGLPSSGTERLDFEAKFPIGERFRRPANLDAAIRYRRGPLKVSAVECKFCEPYGRPHTGLDPSYLAIPELWNGLPALRALASEISPQDARFRHLHAAQIIKHILGLSVNHGADGFRLLYCWYDVQGPEAVRHRGEIDDFRAVAATDGVRFQATTYQDVILRLARGERDEHRNYVDYLAERYL
jgi:hypothetical protein